MPDAKVEIKTLSTEAPKKIIAEEVRRTWLEENPGKKPVDFDQFKTQPQFKSWEVSTLESLKTADTYSRNALKEIPAIKMADVKLKTEIKFNETKASNTYKTLLDQFGKSQFSDKPADNALWPIPIDAGQGWGSLVDEAKVQVQRNATDLATVVSNIRTLASEDIKTSDPQDPNAVKIWEQSKLYDSLTKLETALKSWDDFLSSYVSLVDPKTLRDLAQNCADRFADFAREHAILYKTFKGTDGEPLYIKYQLLATTKALAEKVASQFATRATTSPSFSAMYERIIDVPRTGTLNEAMTTSKRLAETYAKGTNPKLDVAWKEELGKLGKQLKKQNDLAFKNLDMAFRELNKTSINAGDVIVKKLTIEESLKFWSKNFESFGSLQPTVLNNLQAGTSGIALDLGKYKQAVDTVLAAPEFNDIRRNYQSLLDGITMRIQSQILLCQSLG